jgi:hypothetical protein
MKNKMIEPTILLIRFVDLTVDSFQIALFTVTMQRIFFFFLSNSYFFINFFPSNLSLQMKLNEILGLQYAN